MFLTEAELYFAKCKKTRDSDSLFGDYAERSVAIRRFGFPVVTARLISRIQVWGYKDPWVEVGAGNAYLTHLLQEAGVDAIATDTQLPDPDKGYGFEKAWTDIEQLTGNAAVRKYPERNLIISWPNDYDKPRGWSDYALWAFRGRLVCFIGEDKGGCTGSDRFHDLLNRLFVVRERVDIPQWRGLHDAAWIYERKER